MCLLLSWGQGVLLGTACWSRHSPGLGDIRPGHGSQLCYQFLCGLGRVTLICRPRSQAPFPHGHLLAWQQEPGIERGRRARELAWEGCLPPCQSVAVSESKMEGPS